MQTKRWVWLLSAFLVLAFSVGMVGSGVSSTSGVEGARVTRLCIYVEGHQVQMARALQYIIYP